jgi:hypothetical protein
VRGRRGGGVLGFYGSLFRCSLGVYYLASRFSPADGMMIEGAPISKEKSGRAIDGLMMG